MANKSINNPLVGICRRHLAACNAIELTEEAQTLSLDPILETLPLVIKRPGLVYEVITPGVSHGLGGECICYARPEDIPPFAELKESLNPFREVYLPKPYIPLWKALDWTFTPEGMWQWVLLEDLWRNLPLFWHANYSKIEYVFDLASYKAVMPELNGYLTPTGRPRKGYQEEIERWASSERKAGHNPFNRSWGFFNRKNMYNAIELARNADKFFAPKSVQVDDNAIDVTFTAWNAWAGLKQICYRMEVSRRVGIKMTRTVDNLLVKYNCGICF